MDAVSLSFQNTSKIEEKDLNDSIERLSEYISHLRGISRKGGYSTPESSINLPFDKELYEEVVVKAQNLTNENLKYVVVIGIGGSNLGTRAIYDALRGMYDMLRDGQHPKMLFLDTIDYMNFRAVLDTLKNLNTPDEFLVNVISKSGTTTETIVNLENLIKDLEDRFGEDVLSRIVVSTDKESAFWKAAEKKELALLSIPKNIGGRYSVFSVVGLFPLAAVGIDISMLLRGARKGQKDSLKELPEENQALVSAGLVYGHYKQGIKIYNMFLFDPALESVGKWYRQLIGESLGKKHDVEGSVVNAGITPVVSIGSTDLHSMVQLYFGGPKDKFTTFVYVSAKNNDVCTPSDLFLSGLVKGIEKRSFGEIMHAIYEGVKSAYKDNNLPFMETELKERNEFALGYFLQIKMIEVMYLAKLININAFDQPGIEDYKKKTRILLNRQR